MVLACILLIASLMFSTVALAKEKKKKPKKPEIVSDPEDPNGPLDLDKSQMLSIEEITEPVGLYSILVYINEPCDEEWRSHYSSNWMYYANYAVERADNRLYEWFEIDYRSVAQNVWDSNDYIHSLGDRLEEAKGEIGHTNGSDIMVAFTKQSTNDGLAGVAYVGYGWTIVKWQGSGTDWKVTQHETGHNYGLHHCSNSCLMNSPYNYNDMICEYHKNQWYQNRYRY